MKTADRKQKHILRDKGHSMKLYHMPGACSLADLIVLEWIGMPHEIVRMSFESIKSPDYSCSQLD
jgi:glutathione S-transferase